MDIEQKIYNILKCSPAKNKKIGKMPKGMSVADVTNARIAFMLIIQEGFAVTSWKNVIDFFKSNGATITDIDGVSFKITF